MFLNIILMVIALHVDIFVSCAAYGSNQIVLSGKQIAVMNGICCLCMGLALIFGDWIDSQIPEEFTRKICFFSFLFLGCMKLSDSGIRRYLRNRRSAHREGNSEVSKFHLIARIYGDPMEADTDRNHRLSWRELLFLSLAMSMDCGLTGTMAAFMKLPIFVTMCSLFLMGEVSAYTGIWVGKKISANVPRDLSWVSGILFIGMALTKK